MSKLDPFVPYILKHWQEGEYNGANLYQEIRDQGYMGSRPLVSDSSLIYGACILRHLAHDEVG